MNSPSAQRWNHLDNLRWIAMIWGVFVHTLTLGDFGALETISSVSHVFRMPLFFLISGFLGAMLLSRKNRASFILSRLRNLCIPLLVGVFILNIPTIWLMQSYAANASSPSAGAEPSWHLHLWFLVSLAFFSVLAAASNSIFQKIGTIFDKLLVSHAEYFPHAAFLIPFLIMIGFELAILTAITVFEGMFSELPWLIKASFAYLPFYAFGAILFNSPRLRLSLSRVNIPITFFTFFIYVGARFIDLPNSVSGPIETLSLFALRFIICVALMSLGEKVLSWRNEFSIFLSRSIYTVYLVHYALIYVLGNVHLELFGPVHASGFWVISLIAIAIGFIIHHFLVGRFPLFAFMFNGRDIRT